MLCVSWLNKVFHYFTYLNYFKQLSAKYIVYIGTQKQEYIECPI